MSVENRIYPNFKSYGQYQKNARSQKQQEAIANKRSLNPVLGAAIGVASAAIISPKVFKTQKTFDEVGKMLSMAGAANIGAVLAGSVGANKESKKRKWKEAGFQMMNTSIPMIMVSSTLALCEKVKKLNNKPVKIIGSFAAMISGAAIATGITNIGKKENEEKRKYTIKDSVANFDDIVATIAIGFKDINKYVHADKFLPFIYVYCGSRAGQKE